MSFPKRGEIWLGTHPDEDSERPCLIVSVNGRNQFGNNVLMVPSTTNFRPSPTHVEIFAGEGGLSQTSMARCENVTVMYKEYLGNAPLGRTIPENRMKEVEKAILRAVGITV